MKSARGESCTVRIPGHCNFNQETTVAAHYNTVRLGSGKGIKSRHVAYCCSSCHAVLDGAVKSGFTKDELKLMHLEGVLETNNKLADKGLLVYR